MIEDRTEGKEVDVTDIPGIYRTKKQNCIVTAEQLAQSDRQLQELLNTQVQQSVTSHKKRDSRLKRGWNRFFHKEEAPVVGDIQENMQEQATDVREFDYHTARDGMLVVPQSRDAKKSDVSPEYIDVEETELAPPKKLKKEMDKHKLELTKIAGKYKDTPLFSEKPNIQDVQQGRVGDCYFLASVASLIQNDPEQLMKNMKDNGDNTVTVRFFRRRMRDDYLREPEGREFKKSEQSKNEEYARMSAADKLEFLFQKAMFSQASVTEKKAIDTIVALKAGLRPQWRTWKVAGRSLCEYLMQDQQVKAQCGDLFDAVTKCATVDEALQKLYLSDENMLTLAIGQYQMHGGTADANFTIENDSVHMQEIYVTVTKDLPEKVLKRSHRADGQEDVETEAIYAGGPYWVRILEKAYAASGLNVAAKTKGSELTALADLERSYEGIVGGQMNNVFVHLTGKPSNQEWLSYIHNEEKNTLTAAMAWHFGQKWDEEIKTRYHLDDDQTKALREAVEKEDASHRRSTVEKNAETKKRETKYYREQAAGLDDLIRVVLASKIKYASENEDEQRRELALSLAGELAEDHGNKLQFARFSGQYTKNATETLRKIQDALKGGKLVGAGSVSFIPESVKSGGLNGEAIDGGIAQNHAYSILKTCTIGKDEFIVLRNPWASGHNVYRQQADGSVTDEMDHSDSKKGVFLVELNDFLRKFDQLYGV